MKKSLIYSILVMIPMLLASCTIGPELTDEERNRGGDNFKDVPEAYILTSTTRAASTLPGYGQSFSPFKIRNAAELKYFVEAINKGKLHPYAHKPADKDDKGFQERGVVYVELAHDIEVDESYSWIPIGTFANPFVAYFDGKGYKIKGTLMHRNIEPEHNYEYALPLNMNHSKYGFFGFTYDGKISNLTVEAEIKADKLAPYSSIGGLTATANSTKFQNCSFTGSIHNNAGASMQTFAVGGLAGVSLRMTAENCVCDGTFDLDESLKTSNNTFSTESLYIGGLVGSCDSPTFSNCENKTDIKLQHFTAAQANIGGIFGSVRLINSECLLLTNSGNISASNIRKRNSDIKEQGVFVGGIVGNGTLGDNIGKTTNNGDISIRSSVLPAYVGGAGGNIHIGDGFIDLRNDGKVTNNSTSGYTGGCFGYYEGRKFTATNTGDIASTCTESESLPESGSTGGIVGRAFKYNPAKLSEMRNEGDITSADPFMTYHGPQSYAGSIVGNDAPIEASSCINTGKVNGVKLDIPDIQMVGALWLGWQRFINKEIDKESDEWMYWEDRIREFYQ